MIRLDGLRNAPRSTGAERPLASLFAQSLPSPAIKPGQLSVASLGALAAVKPQDDAGAAKPIPDYVAPAIEAALGVRSPDLSNISYHDLTSWKEISQIKPPISQKVQNAFSDSSSVGASFKDNGTIYSLVSRENLDVFSKFFGLSERDALKYVSTQEITHGFLFNHDPEMKIRVNERVAETMTATKYPEVAVAFAAYSDAYGANRNNYLLLITEVQTAAGTALREAGVKPKFEKDSDKFIGMDFLNGFTK